MNKLDRIFNSIKDKEMRWKGMLALQSLSKQEDIQNLVNYLDQDDWVVRWFILKKIGENGHVSVMKKVLPWCQDEDEHVAKQAEATIFKLTENQLTPAVNALKSQSQKTRELAVKIVSEKAQKKSRDLEPYLSHPSWIVANRVLHIIWTKGGVQSESILISALSIKHVQKHSMMMLALDNCVKAIKPIIEQYKHPYLRRHLVNCLMQMSKESCFPMIIRYLEDPRLEDNAKQIILKIGSPIIPYLMADYTSKKDNRNRLFKVLKIITFDSNALKFLYKKISEGGDNEDFISLYQLKTNRR